MECTIFLKKIVTAQLAAKRLRSPAGCLAADGKILQIFASPHAIISISKHLPDQYQVKIKQGGQYL